MTALVRKHAYPREKMTKFHFSIPISLGQTLIPVDLQASPHTWKATRKESYILMYRPLPSELALGRAHAHRGNPGLRELLVG